MKKSIFSKVGAAAMVLTLVTASLVGGTFAKYTSTVSGTATATAAAWKIAFKDSEDNVITKETKFILKPDITTGKVEGTIVPGDTGTLKVKVDGSDTQVDFDYEVSLVATDNDKLHIGFYTDNSYAAEKEITAEKPLVKSIKTSDANKIGEETIYWKLESNDATDTDMAGKLGEYTVTLTATQKTTTSTEPTVAP